MSGARWQRTGFGVGGLIALAILFLGIVMLANIGLRGMRLDLTENRLYTLSPGTQSVLTASANGVAGDTCDPGFASSAIEGQPVAVAFTPGGLLVVQTRNRPRSR